LAVSGSLPGHYDCLLSRCALVMGGYSKRSDGICHWKLKDSHSRETAILRAVKFEKNAAKLMVVVVPDFGERHLSTILFQNLKEEAANLPTVDADVDTFFMMKSA